ncbi:MAG: DUF922 domain-containing protein [Candidatus Rokubacteria bacterium]|nr:DUF922 domain-containing protein [Candidatus Rokubacteria bacterium]
MTRVRRLVPPLALAAACLLARPASGGVVEATVQCMPDGGSVHVIAGVEGRQDAGRAARLRVAVVDTGIGIKPEDPERIFHSFEQVDSSYGREQQGTGLGLAHSLASTWLAPAASFRMSNLGGPCVITHVEVLLRVTFSYPILYLPGAPPEGLLERWDNFLAIVQRHEEGHRAIAIEHGYEILRRLATLPGLHTCPALEAAVAATVRALNDHYEQRHAVFDAQTPDNAAAALR